MKSLIIDIDAYAIDLVDASTGEVLATNEEINTVLNALEACDVEYHIRIEHDK